MHNGRRVLNPAVNEIVEFLHCQPLRGCRPGRDINQLDIRTTMNVYGGALDDTMREYNGKVVRMALRAS